MKELKEDIKYFLNNKIFMSILIIVTLLSYGFAITHVSIGIDDLCLDRYVKDTYILSANRWGTWGLYNVLGITEFSPFWSELITTILYIATAIIACATIKNIVKDKISSYSYIIFAGMFISFPILSYPFTYQSTNISVALSNLIALYIAFACYKNYLNGKDLKKYFIYTLILTIAISMYEAEIQTYILWTFAYLLLHIKYVDNKIKFSEIFECGFLSAIVVIGGLIIWIAIAAIIKAYLEFDGTLVTDFAYRAITFLSNDVKENFIMKYKLLFINNNVELLLTIIKYSMFIFVLINIYETIKNKTFKYIFLALGVILSNFIFYIILENVLFRVNFSWAIMVAFEIFYSYEVLKNLNIKYLNKILFVLCMLIIIYQTYNTNQKLYEDFRIAENSKRIATVIGDTIVSECEDYNNKPIIYIMKEQMEINYEKEILVWGVNAFNEYGIEITKYFNYLGYNFESADEKIYNEKLYVEDYENAQKYNKFVSEGEKYIYVNIDYDIMKL